MILFDKVVNECFTPFFLANLDLFVLQITILIDHTSYTNNYLNILRIKKSFIFNLLLNIYQWNLNLIHLQILLEIRIFSKFILQLFFLCPTIFNGHVLLLRDSTPRWLRHSRSWSNTRRRSTRTRRRRNTLWRSWHSWWWRTWGTTSWLYFRHTWWRRNRTANWTFISWRRWRTTWWRRRRRCIHWGIDSNNYIRLDYRKLPGGGGIDAGLGGTKWFSVNAKFYGTSAI